MILFFHFYTNIDINMNKIIVFNLITILLNLKTIIKFITIIMYRIIINY